MQLTKHTDYAFRVLIYLVSQPAASLKTIQEISDAYQISKNHMMKIVQKMTQAGLLHSVRGQGGGVTLGRPPQEIFLREVVELMEPTLKPVNCEHPLCSLNPRCQLKGVLFEAQELYLSHLEKFTLQDIKVGQIQNLLQS